MWTPQKWRKFAMQPSLSDGEFPFYQETQLPDNLFNSSTEVTPLFWGEWMVGWLVGWLEGPSFDVWKCGESEKTPSSNWHIQIGTLARTLCLDLRRPYLFVCINNFLYVELRTNTVYVDNVMIDLQRLPSTPSEWSNYDVTKTHKSSNNICLMFLPSTFAKHHPPKKR